MPKALSKQERIKRARESIQAARDELAKLPPRGRERTYVIARTRKHLGIADRVLRPLLPKAHPSHIPDPDALILDEQIDRLWPDPNRVYNHQSETWE